MSSNSASVCDMFATMGIEIPEHIVGALLESMNGDADAVLDYCLSCGVEEVISRFSTPEIAPKKSTKPSKASALFDASTIPPTKVAPKPAPASAWNKVASSVLTPSKPEPTQSSVPAVSSTPFYHDYTYQVEKLSRCADAHRLLTAFDENIDLEAVYTLFDNLSATSFRASRSAASQAPSYKSAGAGEWASVDELVDTYLLMAGVEHGHLPPAADQPLDASVRPVAWTELPYSLIAPVLELLGTMDVISLRQCSRAWQAVCDQHTRTRTRLALGQLKHYESVMLQRALRLHPQLTHVSLRYVRAEHRAVVSLVSVLPATLTSITLSGLALRSSDWMDIIAFLAQHCPQLTELHAAEAGLTDAVAQYIAQVLPQLQVLTISGNPITEEGVSALLERRALRSLTAQRLCVAPSVYARTTLEHLDVSHNAFKHLHIASASLRTLTAHHTACLQIGLLCPSLRSLDVSHSPITSLPLFTPQCERIVAEHCYALALFKPSSPLPPLQLLPSPSPTLGAVPGSAPSLTPTLPRGLPTDPALFSHADISALLSATASRMIPSRALWGVNQRLMWRARTARQPRATEPANTVGGTVAGGHSTPGRRLRRQRGGRRTVRLDEEDLELISTDEEDAEEASSRRVAEPTNTHTTGASGTNAPRVAIGALRTHFPVGLHVGAGLLPSATDHYCGDWLTRQASQRVLGLGQAPRDAAEVYMNVFVSLPGTIVDAIASARAATTAPWACETLLLTHSHKLHSRDFVDLVRLMPALAEVRFEGIYEAPRRRDEPLGLRSTREPPSDDPTCAVLRALGACYGLQTCVVGSLESELLKTAGTVSTGPFASATSSMSSASSAVAPRQLSDTTRSRTSAAARTSTSAAAIDPKFLSRVELYRALQEAGRRNAALRGLFGSALQRLHGSAGAAALPRLRWLHDCVCADGSEFSSPFSSSSSSSSTSTQLSSSGAATQPAAAALTGEDGERAEWLRVLAALHALPALAAEEGEQLPPRSQDAVECSSSSADCAADSPSAPTTASPHAQPLVMPAVTPSSVPEPVCGAPGEEFKAALSHFEQMLVQLFGNTCGASEETAGS